MSLVLKLDEVQELLLRLNAQVRCIVESWLKQHINDSVVNIDGYNITRKDRSSYEHGSVCIYIQDHIKFETPENLQCCNYHEIIWLKLDPPRTPRGFSCITFGLVYYPRRFQPPQYKPPAKTFQAHATREIPYERECNAQLIFN